MKKRTWTDEQLIKAISISTNLSEVLKLIHLKDSGSNFNTIIKRLDALHIDYSHIRKTSWTLDQLKSAILSSISVRQVLQKLGLKLAGGNYKQFYLNVEKYNFDISHFVGQSYLKGTKRTYTPQKPLSTILTANSNYSSNDLRKRLIKEGIFDKACSSCKEAEWCGKPISLELDHINGNHMDNRIENLRILCPNCHAQTDTYRKSKKKSSL